MISINNNGSINWQKVYPGTQAQYFDIKKVISDGGYICAGINQTGCSILKVDSLGNFQWEQNYTGIFLHNIENAENNGFFTAGYEGNHAKVLRLNSAGDIIWSKSYWIKNLYTSTSCFKKINNSYIVTGIYISNSIIKPYFVKLDTNGTEIYQYLFTSPNQESLEVMNMINNNRYVWNFYHQQTTLNDSIYNRLLITDSLGITKFEKIKYTKGYEDILAIQPVTNGDIIFGGNAEYAYNPALQDIYAIRTDSTLNFPNNIIEIKKLVENLIEKHPVLEVYPNPFNNSTIIKVKLQYTSLVKVSIFDLTGREICLLVNEIFSKGIHKMVFNTNKLASGVYFYRIEAGSYVDTKKMVLIK
jgi:hypothetical protein